MTMMRRKDYKGKLREAAVHYYFFFLFLTLFSTIITTHAFAPPHPNHTTYETATQYRRKHNITFNYVPSNLHREACKYMSEAECEHADQSMKLQHLTHQHNQRLLEANPNFNLNMLVLLVRFTDHQDRVLPEPYEYQILLNLRVAKYLEVNSYTNYRVWFDVIPWETTDNTEKHYSFGMSGRTKEFQKSFHPLLDKLWNEGSIDWSIYDSDGDGVLDNLMVLHSSYPAEVGGTDCDTGRSVDERIWSHALADSDQYNWVSPDGSMRTNGYTVAAALSETCGSEPAKIGVITHEYFHAMADLPDLYDTAENAEGQFVNRGRGGTGNFDVMSNPYGVGQQEEDFPSHLCAWTKQQLGWITPKVLNEESPLQDTYTLRPSELYPDILKVNIENFFGFEYLLIENRQRKMFDIKLFGTGITMYHIDESQGSQSFRGFPGQDGWPSNAKHYKVAVLQADQKYDLENLINRGDEGDFWQPGSTLGPNSDGETYPNTDTYGTYLGVYPSNIEVRILEQIGDDMVVQVVIPDDLVGRGPDPDDSGLFATNPRETKPPYQLSGQFQASWFLDEAEEGEQEGAETYTDSVDAAPALDVQEPGFGFVEHRPPEREEEQGTTAASPAENSQVGMGFVVEMPPSAPQKEEEEDPPAQQDQGPGEEATDPAGGPLVLEEEEPQEEEEGQNSAESEQGDSAEPIEGDTNQQAEEPAAEGETEEVAEQSAVDELVTDENGEATADDNEDSQVFLTVEKEPTVAPEQVNATATASTATEAVHNNEPTAIEVTDGEDDIESMDNEGGDSSVFANLFTNTTSQEENKIDAEVESYSEGETDNSDEEDITMPPTLELTIVDIIAPPLEEDSSEAPRVPGSSLLWSFVPMLVVFAFLAWAHC